ncbi:MAG: GNAT family N-acetyltransferase [Oscillospiraceae bacterium]|nr:GNAT family N-acetyltransferase [Oscillospiraceae bacterium]
MHIRAATMKDLAALTAIEAACFPAAEAAGAEDFEKRLAVYPNHFWLLEEEGEIISFVDGMVTNEPNLRDEMYENAGLHREDGAWQMIFGVNTLPEHRKKGCAGLLIRQAIADARAQGRKGLVLTCKDRLVHYYERFGFKKEGVSQSTHGGVVWYEMRLTFSR